jgi:L-alanine-DL-glutamate epimerase-like enolase superfamily enzyme
MEDDARMRASREPMTIARLKQSMDRRFRSIDRRFARLERKKADKSDVRRLERKVDRGFREIRQEINDTADETRRHVDAVAESLHDDFRLFADAIARRSTVSVWV